MPKQKKSRTPVECKKCLPYHNAYVDLSADAERPLEMLATLLQSNRDTELFDPHTVQEIGFTLDSFIQKKLVRDSVFLSRSLRRCALSDLEFRAELRRVRAYHHAAGSSL
jgi:hypothetical protein